MLLSRTQFCPDIARPALLSRPPLAHLLGRGLLRSPYSGSSSRSANVIQSLASQQSREPWRRWPRRKITEKDITQEAAAYWRNVIDKVDKPGLSGLQGALDWGHPLGLTRQRAGEHVQCYTEFLNAKLRHPTAVVLVRIGDFYVAVGFDALVLCQVCDLNPTSPQSGIAEACFHKGAHSLRRRLNRLIEASFTVAVVEEVGVRASSSRSAFMSRGGGFTRWPTKQRRLVSLVSACSPYYLYGDVEDEYDGDDTPLPKLVTGVSLPGVGGYRLMHFCPTSRTIQVHSQLSAEALVAQLHASGLAQPLHLHASVREQERTGDRGLPRVSALGALLGVSVAEFGTLGSVVHGTPAAGSQRDVEDFRTVVGRALGVRPVGLKVVVPALPADTPVPPSLSTIAQLGLGGSPAMPSLLAAALPSSTSAACRNWLRHLLLLPPPPAVAESIRAACAALAAPLPGAAPPLPQLVTSLQGSRLVALLAEGVAGHNTLRDLQRMLVGAAELLQLPGPAGQALAGALSGGVLAWSLNKSAGIGWSEVPPSTFATHCLSAAGVIGALLPDVESGAGSEELRAWALSDEEDEGEDGGLWNGDSAVQDGAEPAFKAGHRVHSPEELLAQSVPLMLREFLHPAVITEAGDCRSAGLCGPRLSALVEAGRLVGRLERFRHHVRLERMPAYVERVAATRRAYVTALLRIAGVLEAAAAAVQGTAVAFTLAANDAAVWGQVVMATSPPAPGYVSKRKLPVGLQRAVLVEASRLASAASPPLALVHPLNRNRATEANRWSSSEAEEAAVAYRAAVDEADREARRLLRQLCGELYGPSSWAPAWLPSGHRGSVVPAISSTSGSPPQEHLVTLLAAVELSVVAAALRDHVLRAKAVGWNWPIMYTHTASPATAAGDVRLSLTGLVPYWMDRRDAVPNDLQLSAGCMVLLTGPNMAGKSTVLRSIAAATLLAICGLAVPAGNPTPSYTSSSSPSQTSTCCHRQPLEVAWLSYVHLRNFSGDSPMAGKSAFAVEMEDTAHMLQLAEALGPRALVLLDELGKGTEMLSGTALAGAVLSELAARGCCGVMATHMHDMALLGAEDARLGRLVFWAMEVQEEPPPPGSLVPVLSPTRRVRMGATSTHSLAMQVAASCGMPDDVLATAVALERQLGAVWGRAREIAFAPEVLEAAAARSEPDRVEYGLGLDLEAGSGGLEPLGELAAHWSLNGPPPVLLSLGQPTGAVSASGGHSTHAGGVQVEAAEPTSRTLDSVHAAEDECVAAASEVLHAEVRAALSRAGQQPRPEDGELYWVRPEHTPNYGHAGKAAVYVLRRWDGLLYVGESEDVAARIKAHRAAETRERRKAEQALKRGRRNITTLVAVYALVVRAAGNVSMAREVKESLIRALQDRGLALQSDHGASARSTEPSKEA